MALTGEVRFAQLLKGIMSEWEEIDWLTSETFIKRCLTKISELAADAKLIMPESKKRALVVEKLQDAAKYFKSQWKGANGDRTAYKIKPEVLDKLKFVLGLMDVPIEEVQRAPINPVEPGSIPVPPPSPVNMLKTDMKPSKAPAVKQDSLDEKMGRKSKGGFMSSTGGKVAVAGGAVALILAAAAILTGKGKKGGPTM